MKIDEGQFEGNLRVEKNTSLLQRVKVRQGDFLIKKRRKNNAADRHRPHKLNRYKIYDIIIM